MVREIIPPELKIQRLTELNHVIKDIYDYMMKMKTTFDMINDCVLSQINNPDSSFNSDIENYVNQFINSYSKVKELFKQFRDLYQQLYNYENSQLSDIQQNLNDNITNWKNTIDEIGIPQWTFMEFPFLFNSFQADIDNINLFEILAKHGVGIYIKYYYRNTSGVITFQLETQITEDDREVLSKVWKVLGWFKDITKYDNDNGFWGADATISLFELFENLTKLLTKPKWVWDNATSGGAIAGQWTKNETNAGFFLYYYNEYVIAGWGKRFIEISVNIDKAYFSTFPNVICIPRFWEDLQVYINNAEDYKNMLDNLSSTFELLTGSLTDLKQQIRDVHDYIKDFIPIIQQNILYMAEELYNMLTNNFTGTDELHFNMTIYKLIDTINDIRKCLGKDPIEWEGG